jgi:putative redox protein
MPLESEHEYAEWVADWKGGLATEVTGRGHTIRVDEPPEFGGEDTGPMPTEVLAAALASCFCIALAWGAKKRRIAVDSIQVKVRPHRAPGEPRHGAYDLTVVTSASAEEIAPAMDLAKRYCWVTNTLMNPPEIRYHLGAPAGS